ncbi:MAG: hypothetical protein LC620_06125, partial [Halobacteriales archaeon]|nr:hypothetical protein [Halobacteriales archaeon]
MVGVAGRQRQWLVRALFLVAVASLLPTPAAATIGGASPTVRDNYYFIDSIDAGSPKPAYLAESMTGSTNYNFGDEVDGAVENIPIGFSFKFYGLTYTAFSAQSAGYIWFGAAADGNGYRTCCVAPSTMPAYIDDGTIQTVIENAIFGAYADYDGYHNYCTRGEPVHVKTFGSAPARMTAIEFYQLRYEVTDPVSCDGGPPAPAPNQCSCTKVTFQIKLWETSN